MLDGLLHVIVPYLMYNYVLCKANTTDATFRNVEAHFVHLLAVAEREEEAALLAGPWALSSPASLISRCIHSDDTTTWVPTASSGHYVLNRWDTSREL